MQHFFPDQWGLNFTDAHCVERISCLLGKHSQRAGKESAGEKNTLLKIQINYKLEVVHVRKTPHRNTAGI